MHTVRKRILRISGFGHIEAHLYCFIFMYVKFRRDRLLCYEELQKFKALFCFYSEKTSTHILDFPSY